MARQQQIVVDQRDEQARDIADLANIPVPWPRCQNGKRVARQRRLDAAQQPRLAQKDALDPPGQTGRASCRERVCQYVEISVVALALTKKNKTKTTPDA